MNRSRPFTVSPGGRGSRRAVLNRLGRSLALPIVLLLTPTPLFAGTIQQQNGPARLELRFDGETPRLALADLLSVTLTVEGHESLRVRAPHELTATEPWQLVERSIPQRIPVGTDRVRWQLHYKFAPREPGTKVPFAFPEVAFREKDDDERSVTFDPVECTVIAPFEPADFRDITAIEELPAVPVKSLEWRWPAVAVAIIALMGIVLIVRFLLRRRRLRSNAQLALYELQRLNALSLAEQNRSERFITLLTMLVRRFLEREFDIPARRRTTPEFVQELDRHAALTTEEKQFLAEFLQQSEHVKFANQAMSLADCQRWAKAVEAFLQRRARKDS
jgi:hypothetical protein